MVRRRCLESLRSRIREGASPIFLPAALILAASVAPALAAANCNGTSVGFVPLNDLGAGIYLASQGGLYPGGGNVRPPSHENDANVLARVVPLDPNGTFSPSGRIVLLSIGMSIATQEFSVFVQNETQNPSLNQAVTLVDGAQVGWSAQYVADPNANGPFWSAIDTRLWAAGVSRKQVEAVWLKEADAYMPLAFPQDALVLQGNLQTIVQMLKSRYVSLKQIYLSSRSYSGYSTTTLDPEPFSYESGFGVKWLIEAQINGSAALNFNPKKGAVLGAWLAWGPYLWADGLTPRSDGLIWECADYDEEGGTHPTTAGREKAADLLATFFHNDTVAKRWYQDCSPSDAGAFSVPADVLNFKWTVGPRTLIWDDLAPSSGTATTHDIVTGKLLTLRKARSFAGSTCAASGVAGGSWVDTTADPPLGQPVYYLIRGHNSCGPGTYGEYTALAAPRASLDAASPCP